MKTTKHKIIVVAILLLSFFLFKSVNTNLAPERNKEQKAFDDFLANLGNIYKDRSGDMASEILKDNSLYPSFELQYYPANPSSGNLSFSLNWSDIQNVKKGLRILELLSLANIFSSKGGQNQLLITTSTGYKFRASFDNAELKNNNSLTLALVLLKNNS